jgi:hypothetical protein
MDDRFASELTALIKDAEKLPLSPGRPPRITRAGGIFCWKPLTKK